MSRKSRRARARLVQEQTLVSNLRKQVKRDAETELSLQCKILRLEKELFDANQLIEKQRRKDVIVAYKSNSDIHPGPCYAINITIDATHLNLMFRTPVKKSHLEWDISETKSVGDYACRMVREISRKLERGIADIITGKVVREEIV